MRQRYAPRAGQRDRAALVNLDRANNRTIFFMPRIARFSGNFLLLQKLIKVLTDKSGVDCHLALYFALSMTSKTSGQPALYAGGPVSGSDSRFAGLAGSLGEGLRPSSR